MLASELIARGGPVMYLLLGCSIFALGIIMERGVFWTSELRRIPHKRIDNFLAALKKGKISGTIAPSQSNREQEIITQLTSAAKLGGMPQVVATLQLESSRAYERSMRHLSGLDTIVSIAPLLGILGTVLGIMKSFQALDLKNMNAPGAIGHGLGEAMITTATGLMIAVPTLIMFNFFSSMADRHASRLHRQADTLSLPLTPSDKAPSLTESRDEQEKA